MKKKQTRVSKPAYPIARPHVPVCSNRRLAALKTMTPGTGPTPYSGYTGTCRWTGYGFFGLAVLNRVHNLTCLCPKQV